MTMSNAHNNCQNLRPNLYIIFFETIFCCSATWVYPTCGLINTMEICHTVYTGSQTGLINPCNVCRNFNTCENVLVINALAADGIRNLKVLMLGKLYMFANYYDSKFTSCSKQANTVNTQPNSRTRVCKQRQWYYWYMTTLHINWV